MTLKNAQRIVIKIGSSLLVDQEDGSLNKAWLETLVEDVLMLKEQGKQVIIVASGSVAMGKKHIKKTSSTLKLEEKQAAAACGQTELMQNYKELFLVRGIVVAQILLTVFDSESRRNYLNAKNTMETLLENGLVPIINENDTVATHELRFGDNDRLAARVAQMTDSDHLVLLSDVDGMYTANPKINANAEHFAEITEITKEIEDMAEGALSTGLGSGGMITKVEAAKMAMISGCSTILASGHKLNPIKFLDNGGKHTKFVAPCTPTNARKEWIANSLNVPGRIVVDRGAVKAIKNGSSLLPAGVIDVEGDFARGDTVEIVDPKLNKVGVGISAYASRDAKLIMGQNSNEIVNIIGFSGRDELIHRDNMVVNIEDGYEFC